MRSSGRQGLISFLAAFAIGACLHVRTPPSPRWSTLHQPCSNDADCDNGVACIQLDDRTGSRTCDVRCTPALNWDPQADYCPDPLRCVADQAEEGVHPYCSLPEAPGRWAKDPTGHLRWEPSPPASPGNER